MQWWREVSEAAFAAGLGFLFWFAVAREQRSLPKTTWCGDGQVLELLPSRAMMALMIVGFIAIGPLTAVWCGMVLSRAKHFFSVDVGVRVFVIFSVIFMIAMTATTLYGVLYCWRSRVLILSDGLLLRLWPKKPSFVPWKSITKVKYWFATKEIRITTIDSSRYTLDTAWNGVGFLYLCFVHFLKEEQWREAKDAINEFLAETKELEAVQNSFADTLLNGSVVAAAEIDPAFR